MPGPAVATRKERSDGRATALGGREPARPSTWKEWLPAKSDEPAGTGFEEDVPRHPQAPPATVPANAGRACKPLWWRSNTKPSLPSPNWRESAAGSSPEPGPGQPCPPMFSRFLFIRCAWRLLHVSILHRSRLAFFGHAVQDVFLNAHLQVSYGTDRGGIITSCSSKS